MTTAAAVVAVAVVAAVISYQHAYELVHSHGESGIAARLLPFTVDGLIWAASMVVPDASRRGQPVPRLAAWSLGTGIAATIGANLAHGVGHGPVGALVSAWPALALVGSFELLMMLIRTGRSTGRAVPGLNRGTSQHHRQRKKHHWNCRLRQAWNRRFEHGTRRARVSAPLPESSTSTAERSSASSIQRMTQRTDLKLSYNTSLQTLSLFSSSDFGGLKDVDRVGQLPGAPGASSGACAG